MRRHPEIDHDRAVAIFDLLDENFFDLVDGPNGPYNLHLSVEENRLLFGVCDEADYSVTDFSLPISNFRSIIKDYFVVCDSYYDAIKTASPSRIEAIDMGRRGLHNEGLRRFKTDWHLMLKLILIPRGACSRLSVSYISINEICLVNRHLSYLPAHSTPCARPWAEVLKWLHGEHICGTRSAFGPANKMDSWSRLWGRLISIYRRTKPRHFRF